MTADAAPKKQSKNSLTASAATRQRWARQKAAQRRRRDSGGFFVQVAIERPTVERLTSFVKVEPGENLRDHATAAEVVEAAIERGAYYRERVLELEARVAELEGRGGRK